MVAGALISLALVICAALYEYLGTNPTFLLVMKIILYFSLIIFFTCIIAYLFSTAPPIPDSGQSPI